MSTSGEKEATASALFDVPDAEWEFLEALFVQLHTALAVYTDNYTRLYKKDRKHLAEVLKAARRFYEALLPGGWEQIEVHLRSEFPVVSEKLLKLTESPKKATGSAKGNSFVVPSREEVINRMLEKGGDLELAKRFYAYYEHRGWKLSNGQPMRSWEAAIQRWVRQEAQYQSKRKEK